MIFRVFWVGCLNDFFDQPACRMLFTHHTRTQLYHFSLPQFLNVTALPLPILRLIC